MWDTFNFSRDKSENAVCGEAAAVLGVSRSTARRLLRGEQDIKLTEWRRLDRAAAFVRQINGMQE